ncbi:Cationic amino acid transporter 2 isoform 1 [Hibiscus syriacus]|uniref:Cationic amino acid transporter 2 isoform 1 n=1 Tax=Hibiscus syriacus TaxID=106335 RepID=A0A6A2XD60_HIBSY|nr:uncharacterized protein LOC120189847 [Hibiscus syriacus]KAE8660046.1 Cationic amino acid transporter 2 isoform 1 [Hibiscus syriacus]
MSKAEEVNSPQPPPYFEVSCKISGKKTRFAPGTNAGFAVSLINRKLGIGAPVALYIESVKEGEEPIVFGPEAVLVNYGNGWNLQTVSDMDFSGIGMPERLREVPTPIPNGKKIDGSHSTKTISEQGINFVYIAKVLLAFVMMFMLGGVFMLALDSLPELILLLDSFK